MAREKRTISEATRQATRLSRCSGHRLSHLVTKAAAFYAKCVVRLTERNFSVRSIFPEFSSGSEAWQFRILPSLLLCSDTQVATGVSA